MLAGGPRASVYVALSLSNGLGGVIKGLSGFGSAIINLLVWVTLTTAGVNAGTLQQAVLTDCISCITVGIPLIIMTKAHRTADLRLAVPLFGLLAAASPIGAALLTHLDPRQVELVMALVLLLVIVIHTKLPQLVRDKWRQWREQHRRGTACEPLEPAHETHDPNGRQRADDEDDPLLSIAMDVPLSPLPRSRCSLASDRPEKQAAGSAPVPPAWPTSVTRVAVPIVRCNSDCGARRERSGSGSRGRVSDTGNAILATPTASSPSHRLGSLAAEPHQPQQHAGARCAAAEGSKPAEAAPLAVAPGDEAAAGHTGIDERQRCTSANSPTCGLSPGGNALSVDGACQPGYAAAVAGAAMDAQPLLQAGCEQSSERDKAPPPSRRVSSSLIGADGRVWGGVGDWRDRREVLRITLYACAAGACSGVMAGMTGMGGPPTMYMYDKLKVPKDCVRGTNAIGNVLQFRLISYILLGVFKIQDAVLYACAATCSLIGTAIGNSLAGKLDQRGFSRMLVALMVVCCVLLFASAAGMAGK